MEVVLETTPFFLMNKIEKLLIVKVNYEVEMIRLWK